VSRCAGITKGGERCRLDALEGASYCYGHSPEHASERSRNASKAGRSGGNGRGGPSELATIKKELRRTIDAVREGALERGRGAIVFQGYGYLLRAVELERKVTESGLEERIFGLEESLASLLESEARWRRA
jgi:hypothetical protein